MKDFFKGKFATSLVVIATVILAGVAIFTALQLYNLRQQPVAPNAPAKPKASTTPEACSLLTFTITGNSPTISPTGVVITSTPTTAQSTVTLTPTTAIVLTPTPITVVPPSIASAPTCDSTKPEKPVLTSVKKNGTQAVLTWTKSELATHYVISYGLTANNLEFGVPNTGNVLTYTINSLNASSTYFFTVYAVNNCMPSDGSVILGSVAGTSSASNSVTSSSTPTPTSAGTGGGATLPDAGSGFITILTFGIGISLITFALLLAI